jgi:hypothetical protein
MLEQMMSNNLRVELESLTSQPLHEAKDKTSREGQPEIKCEKAMLLNCTNLRAIVLKQERLIGSMLSFILTFSNFRMVKDFAILRTAHGK